MPQYSKESLNKLSECDYRLRDLFNEIIEYIDLTIITGYRSNEEQTIKYEQGLSKAKAGESKHNKFPSLAIDIAPYPIDWNDIKRWQYVCGFIMGYAQAKNIPLIWGGDFKNLKDLGHFELKEV